VQDAQASDGVGPRHPGLVLAQLDGGKAGESRALLEKRPVRQADELARQLTPCEGKTQLRSDAGGLSGGEGETRRRAHRR